MHSSVIAVRTRRALPALAVALATTLAACGGGGVELDGDRTTALAGSASDARARALHAGTSIPDAASRNSDSNIAPATSGTQTLKLGAPDGMAGDLFGWSVAFAGSRVVVGSPQESPAIGIASNPGRAYVFDASGSLVRELLPTSAAERRRDDSYGRAVAASRKRIAVGAPRADDVGSSAGEVFVFDAATGAQVSKLVPTGTRRNPSDFAVFGSAVDVSADRLVVGAPGTFADGSGRLGGQGAIYLYDADTGRSIARVTPPGTRPGDNVGHSVAVAGRTVVAGAPFDSVSARFAGAAYVFDASDGRLRLKLTAPDASAEARFGFAVSTSGGLIAVGAPLDAAVGSASGSVYLFDAATGAFVRKIVASDAGTDDQFGIAVDLAGNRLAVGAWGDNGGAGSVYVFDAGTGAELAKRVASDAAPLDILGRSVALSGSAVLAGAARDADRGTDSGSVYRFGPRAP